MMMDDALYAKRGAKMIEQSLRIYLMYPIIATFLLLIAYLEFVHVKEKWHKKHPLASQSIRWILLGGCIFFLYTFAVTLLPGLTVKSPNPVVFDFVAGTATPFLDQLRLVSVEDPQTFALLGGDKRTVGNYRALDRSIHIMNTAVIPEVWFHELGHAVWFYQMTDAQRNTFDEIHELTMHTNGTFPSTYARTNAREDWAESFSIYVVSANGGGLDIHRRFLVENVIKSIDPECVPDVIVVGNETTNNFSHCVWTTKRK
jgi:hypothetical protein